MADGDQKQDRLLRIDQVADRLGLSVGTIYRWHYDNRMPGMKVGGRIRWRESEIDEFISGNKTVASVDNSV